MPGPVLRRSEAGSTPCLVLERTRFIGGWGAPAAGADSEVVMNVMGVWGTAPRAGEREHAGMTSACNLRAVWMDSPRKDCGEQVGGVE